MTAETIAHALGGSKTGTSYMAKCPAHNDRVPSLSLKDSPNGQVLLHCHAGCDQTRVIDALKSLGLWEKSPQREIITSKLLRSSDHSDRKRTAYALRDWKTTVSGEGTIMQTYLGSRRITLPIPERLRFHAALKHPTGRFYPAMVALVTRATDDAPMAIHRTFLRADGVGKVDIAPNRMMLGPCRGGAVRLDTAEDTVMIGEGIETCLSAMQATGLPAWAALSTSGLRSLDLPNSIHRVIILADGDDAGHAAARTAAARLRREDRDIRIARSPRGTDFNDLLLSRSTGNPAVVA